MELREKEADRTISNYKNKINDIESKEYEANQNLLKSEHLKENQESVIEERVAKRINGIKADIASKANREAEEIISNARLEAEKTIKDTEIKNKELTDKAKKELFEISFDSSLNKAVFFIPVILTISFIACFAYYNSFDLLTYYLEKSLILAVILAVAFFAVTFFLTKSEK